MFKTRVLEHLPPRRMRIGAVIAALFLVASACGGDDASDTTSATTAMAETTTTTTPTTTTSAPPATEEREEDDHDHEEEHDHEEDDHDHEDDEDHHEDEDEHEEDHEHEEEHEEEDDHEHEDDHVDLTVTDGSGREITLESPAERVLCVQDNCTDLTSDLGIVPVAQHRGDGWGSPAAYYGDDAADIPVLGDRMSVEEVAQYEPDLIIGRVGEEEVRDALEVVAPVYLVDIGGVETLKEGWIDVGILTGRHEEAEAAIERFEANVAALASDLPDGAVDTRVAVGFGDTNWMIWDSSSFCEFLHDEGAGTCAFPDQGESEYGSPDSEFSWEFIVETDPEVWVMITWPGSARYDTVAEEVWLNTTAHREGRVCEEDSAGSFGHGLLMLQWAYQCYLYAGWPAIYDHPGDLAVWLPPSS
ncbi:MAG: ABC transporter substrate-binding protein [Acidimicrobiia bacterium]|nr:ABC transporter substrate-binding protein [Acidimicrobiia bacterium]